MAVKPQDASIQIASFYHFSPVPAAELKRLADVLEKRGKELELKGLIIFGAEGINGTISGLTREAVLNYLHEASSLLGIPELQARWSASGALPFRKFKVRRRVEIVTLGKPDILPKTPVNHHLTPAEWQKALEEEDVLVLDTRNWYETRIGTFTNAIDPKLHEFSEFGAYLDKTDIPKDKKILIYCTGGIRCEKAILEMNEKGFANVHQLQGGILNYLSQFPNRNFEGECFVFDQRVAVDQELKPSNAYKLCPHCGQPADQTVICPRCSADAVVCPDCTAQDITRTCSKNCSHHYTLRPGQKGKSQKQGYRYEAAAARPRSLASQSLNDLKLFSSEGRNDATGDSDSENAHRR